MTKVTYLIEILPPMPCHFRGRVDFQLRGNSCRLYAPCLRVLAGFCTTLFSFLCLDGFFFCGAIIDRAHLAEQELMERPGFAEHFVMSDLGIPHLFVLLFLRVFIPASQQNERKYVARLRILLLRKDRWMKRHASVFQHTFQ